MSKVGLLFSAAFISGSAAVAGPYVNVENNAGFLGTDYAGSVTDLAIGYSADIGTATTVGAQIAPLLLIQMAVMEPLRFQEKFMEM